MTTLVDNKSVSEFCSALLIGSHPVRSDKLNKLGGFQELQRRPTLEFWSVRGKKWSGWCQHLYYEPFFSPPFGLKSEGAVCYSVCYREGKEVQVSYLECKV